MKTFYDRLLFLGWLICIHTNPKHKRNPLHKFYKMCKIPVFNFVKPCLKGNCLLIKIPKEVCKIVLQNCSNNLHGRSITSKSTCHWKHQSYVTNSWIYGVQLLIKIYFLYDVAILIFFQIKGGSQQNLECRDMVLHFFLHGQWILDLKIWRLYMLKYDWGYMVYH